MEKISNILIYLYIAVIMFISVAGTVHNIKKLTDNEYDISSNLEVSEVSADSDSKDADMKVIDTDHIRVTLSHGKSWSVRTDHEKSITIYNDASRNAGSGGALVTIMAFSPDDREYESFPDYSIIGESEGLKYVAVYPTDVQFDPENRQAMEDYQAVMEEVNKIRSCNTDSPVVLKGV